MTTLAALNTAVASLLRDPGYLAFSPADFDAMINTALSEVSRISPMQFRDDITVIADTLDYSLATYPNVQVRRIEVWDTSVVPDVLVGRLQPSQSEYINMSSTGWDVWNSTLSITGRQLAALDPAIHVLRVWGYAGFTKMTASVDADLSFEQQEAVKEVARIEGLKLLTSSRALFSQWQTAAHATDVTMASLMSDLSLAQEAWRRKSRLMVTLREAP